MYLFNIYFYIPYMAIMAGAVFLKYIIVAACVKKFGWSFKAGPIKGNIFGTIIVTVMAAAIMVPLIFAGGFLLNTPDEGLAGTIIISAAAVALSSFSSFWPYSAEMNELRENNIKLWFGRLAAGALVSLISAAAGLIIFAALGIIVIENMSVLFF